jgi:hypothetical protein
MAEARGVRFKPLNFPGGVEPEMYQTVKTSLGPIFEKAILRQSAPFILETGKYFDHDLKPEADQLVTEGKGKDLFTSIADSTGAPLLRALLYFELSRVGRVPIILHPSKAGFLQEYKEFIITQPAASVIKDLVKKGYQDLSGASAVKHQVPPLEMLIFRYAQQLNISAIEATIQIHQSQPCIAFRDHLLLVQKAILEQNQPEVGRLCADAKRYIEGWARTGNFDEGLRSITRTITWQPLQAISAGTVEINPPPRSPSFRDEILGWWVNKPPMYLFFLSDWFAGSPQNLARTGKQSKS